MQKSESITTDIIHHKYHTPHISFTTDIIHNRYSSSKVVLEQNLPFHRHQIRNNKMNWNTDKRRDGCLGNHRHDLDLIQFRNKTLRCSCEPTKKLSKNKQFSANQMFIKHWSKNYVGNTMMIANIDFMRQVWLQEGHTEDQKKLQCLEKVHQYLLWEWLPCAYHTMPSLVDQSVLHMLAGSPKTV